MERPSKRARLLDLRSRLPHISQSALEAVLKEASKHALPKATRSEIRGSRDEHCRQVTPYGAIHQCIELPRSSGSMLRLEVQSPFAMFYYLCLHSKTYGDLVKRAHAKSPSSVGRPWTFILYSDEVSPGNQLAPDNVRKMQALYWSILEFGMDILSEEEAWLEVSICRSKVVQDLVGGQSSLVAAILGLCWGGVGHDMQKSGVHVKFHDGATQLIFMAFGIKIADEAALHAAFGCKGSGGLKPCMLCQNVFNCKTERPIAFGDGWAQKHSCTCLGKEVPLNLVG
eukprot:6455300-Amphidinium_carterae.2